jgi:hypothetical protein
MLYYIVWMDNFESLNFKSYNVLNPRFSQSFRP